MKKLCLFFFQVHLNHTSCVSRLPDVSQGSGQSHNLTPIVFRHYVGCAYSEISVTLRKERHMGVCRKCESYMANRWQVERRRTSVPPRASNSEPRWIDSQKTTQFLIKRSHEFQSWGRHFGCYCSVVVVVGREVVAVVVVVVVAVLPMFWFLNFHVHHAIQIGLRRQVSHALSHKHLTVTSFDRSVVVVGRVAVVVVAVLPMLGTLARSCETFEFPCPSRDSNRIEATGIPRAVA